MNIEQVRAAAEAEFSHSINNSHFRILIAATSSDSDADRLLNVFQDAVRESGLNAEAVRAGSFGCYDLEPVVVMSAPDSSAVLYHNVTPEEVPHFVKDCLKRGVYKRDRALCCVGSKKAEGIPHIDELPLFKLQNRIALRNCGWIDPENIHHYITRANGYTALSRALHMEKPRLLDALGTAMRGRNEIAGSTADAWKLCYESESADKYLICNAIDADRKAMTARLLLESDPHSVLEGMLICAYALAAPHCLIFVKKNTFSARRIKKALEQMRMYSLLGANVLDSPFDSEIEIREVAASSLPGYETELFRCVEEKQPLPKVQPVCPLPDELMQGPVVITCPEIMSNLSADPAGGTDKGKGSKIVTLSNGMIHKYTVEVPFETTVRAIIAELGGGVRSGKAVKGAKLGGPAGVFISSDLLDRSLEGTVVDGGSNPDFCLSTIEVFDSDTCVVDAARDVMSNIQEQSCGKCLFCREGALQMLTILEDIAGGRGSPGDLEVLADLGKGMKEACLCAFGRTAPEPVLSSIQLFRPEYEERMKGSPSKASVAGGEQ